MRSLFWILAGIILGGCTLAAAPTSPPSVNGGAQWEVLAAGLEARLYRPDGDESLVRLLALRVDPAQYVFRAHYRPGEPLTLAQWRDELPGAVAFINTNFFERNHENLGQLVADGVVYFCPYTTPGGMFARAGHLAGSFRYNS